MKETNDHSPPTPEGGPLGECFILKEIQELVYINTVQSSL